MKKGKATKNTSERALERKKSYTIMMRMGEVDKMYDLDKSG